ncbi:hypothetical protein ACFU8I_02665 [Streptomyces sp. NPDC057540]|uniref:hypothetical protein n=1 Tax=Streptomyces sp. NPDC057540 TaxID=3346160 RepID=UPI0036AB19D8
MSDRAYPIHPVPEGESRFTFGLTYDIAKVLEAHGYPPITEGRDISDLQQALYRFLYVGNES